jgi:hypothetical protein
VQRPLRIGYVVVERAYPSTGATLWRFNLNDVRTETGKQQSSILPVLASDLNYSYTIERARRLGGSRYSGFLDRVRHSLTLLSGYIN